MPLCGHGLEDRLDIVDESHVEHPVRFVEDHHLDLGEVEDTTGGSGDDVAPLLELLDLALDAGSAVYGQADMSGVFGELLELIRDLVGQFPGGDQDDRCGYFLFGRYPSENDGTVCTCLSRTGLCLGEHVDSLEAEWDRLNLDRGGLLPSHIIHSLCNIIGDADIREF